MYIPGDARARSLHCSVGNWGMVDVQWVGEGLVCNTATCCCQPSAGWGLSGCSVVVLAPGLEDCVLSTVLCPLTHG